MHQVDQQDNLSVVAIQSFGPKKLRLGTDDRPVALDGIPSDLLAVASIHGHPSADSPPARDYATRPFAKRVGSIAN